MIVELTAEAPGRKAARIDEVRLQIIGSFCHDIRQPLTAALLRATALSDALEQSSHRAALRDLQMSLREIATTSETVFDAVRLSSAEVSIQRSVVDLPRLCSRLESVFQSQAHAKGLAIRFASHRIVAETDESLLLRLLQNLVSNAIKFTATGSISVTCRKVGGSLRCEVKDSGVGMTTQQLKTLASPQFGQRAAKTEAATGAGIGLWNARELSRLLGARLQIASEPGRGTCIRVDLPGTAQRQRRNTLATRTDAQSERSVMVLCDDEQVGRSIERVFVGHGWTCSAFDDPLRFLATINTPGLQPSAVVIPERIGNITADFLLRILSSRFESLPVIVHLQSAKERTAAHPEHAMARLVFGPFTSAAVPVFE